jgi:hypothetical protein
MTILPRSPRQTYKAALFDYDALLAKSDDECCYSLSQREVQIILAQLDYITWKTRYRPTSTEISQETIDKWQGNLTRKLMSGCCGDEVPLQFRYSQSGQLEVSFDGGETWEDGTDYDYRETVTTLPPTTGATIELIKCKSANNIRENMLQSVIHAADTLDGGALLLGIATAIAAFLAAFLSLGATLPLLISIVMTLATIILSKTPAEILAAVDAEQLDILRCIVYCHMDDQGQFTSEAWEAVKSDIELDVTDSLAADIFYFQINALGAKGLGNFGSLGNASDTGCGGCDCDDTWCHLIDFTASNGGFAASPGFTSVYVAGQGWAQGAGQPGIVVIERTITSTTITQVKVNNSIAATNGGTGIRAPMPSLNAAAGSLTGIFNIAYTGTKIVIAFDSNFSGGINPSWAGRLTNVQLRGNGTNPFGVENCPE